MNQIDKLMDLVDAYGNACYFRREVYIDKYKEIRDALAAALPKWQPIETAPKDGTLILVREQRCSGLAIRWDNGWKYESGHTSWLDPEHWMPLPAPPSDQL